MNQIAGTFKLLRYAEVIEGDPRTSDKVRPVYANTLGFLYMEDVVEGIVRFVCKEDGFTFVGYMDMFEKVPEPCIVPVADNVRGL